jgi:hypothetical protein
LTIIISSKAKNIHKRKIFRKFAGMSKVNYDISKQMHQDLIAAYKRVCGECWSQHQAYERMVNEPAPRYYVTPRQASQNIAAMIRGDFRRIDLMMPLRREMYYSLFKVVQELSEKREFIGKSLSYIMKFAVMQPAPKFFISPVRASIIRGFIRNGVFDEDGKVRDEKLPSYVNTRENNRKRTKERKERKEKMKWMLEKMSEGTGVQ